jgi:hypothetical protein
MSEETENKTKQVEQRLNKCSHAKKFLKRPNTQIKEMQDEIHFWAFIS